MQNVAQVSKAVSPALPLLQAGAASGAAAVRAGARSRRSGTDFANMAFLPYDYKYEYKRIVFFAGKCIMKRVFFGCS